MRLLKTWAARAAAALLVLQPLGAYAQTPGEAPADPNVGVLDRSRPEYDPLGLRFGGFVARPSLGFDAGYTDNLFAEGAGADSDVYGVVRARVPVSSDWSRHQVRLEAGVQRRMHVDFPSEDVTTYYGEIGGRYDIGRAGAIAARLRAARDAEPRFSPVAPTDVREPIRFDLREAGVTATQGFNRLTLRGDVLWREIDYDDAVSNAGPIVDQDVRDRSELFLTARADWRMGPSWGLMAQLRTNERDFDIDPPAAFLNQDSQGYTALIGATVSLTRVVRGEASIGWLEQDYEDSSLGTVEGVAFDANVSWYPSELTTVTFTAARSVEESAYYGTGSYTLARGGVRVDHELYRNLIIYGAASYGRREFPVIDREDEVTALDAGAIYLMNRRVGLRLNVRREEQDSEGFTADEDWTVNELTLGVTFAF